MRATPEQIAAAWAAWKVRHKGSIGPGPGFVEAINAALAVAPSDRIDALERENAKLRADCQRKDELLTAAVDDYNDALAALRDAKEREE